MSVILKRTDSCRGVRHAAARVALAVSTLLGCGGEGPSAPDVSRLDGEFDGARRSLPGWALLVQTSGAPDTLLLGGQSNDLALRVQIEFHGPGSYPLRQENVDVHLLVGGDGKTGGYRGSLLVPGELRITQSNGVGSPLRAEFWFDAIHSGGEQRFGPELTFRNGHLATWLEATVPR